jgi:hypothetical protein
MSGVDMDSRKFNRSVNRAARSVALALSVPVVVRGVAGNPLAFAAGMGLLYLAVRGPRPRR